MFTSYMYYSSNSHENKLFPLSRFRSFPQVTYRGSRGSRLRTSDVKAQVLTTLLYDVPDSTDSDVKFGVHIGHIHLCV